MRSLWSILTLLSLNKRHLFILPLPRWKRCTQSDRRKRRRTRRGGLLLTEGDEEEEEEEEGFALPCLTELDTLNCDILSLLLTMCHFVFFYFICPIDELKLKEPKQHET